VWPVIQPQSAVHQKTSLGWWSNTYLKVVAAPTMYPPVVCTTPLGMPVEPDVYSVKSGSCEWRHRRRGRQSRAVGKSFLWSGRALFCQSRFRTGYIRLFRA
jgi:uncharacterized protein (DUF2062 family)